MLTKRDSVILYAFPQSQGLFHAACSHVSAIPTCLRARPAEF